MTDKQTVKFGDICREVKLTTKDPIADGYERYIGLEHLDSGSLNIKRWGIIEEDNPSFTRVFKKGHILFGKRRPYLKKAAIAEFDGVCSGDIIVLEGIPGKIEQSDLPYLIQSSHIWDFAIKTSSGSLSPRTKFKELAKCEFHFKKSIASISGIFRALHNVTHRKRDLHASLLNLENAIINKTLNDGSGKVIELTGQQLLEQGYLSLLQDGNHGSQYPRNHEFSREGLPYLSAQNIDDLGNVDIEACPKLPEERAAKLRISPAQGGDVILTHNATVGRVAILDKSLSTVIGSTSTTYYRVVSGKLTAHYLAAYLRSSYFQNQLTKLMKQSTRNQVPITTQKKMQFLVPDMKTQELIEKISDLFSIKELAINEDIVDSLKESIERACL
ncbi:restriction modification system DNA specificity subunit [Alteromonas mediterranea 615]|uniref:Restriction modification system DNA specificity subunit n=1 Tax=Alteromonas mediterranea 615 TaxID=1300253 RepID=S5AD38_9ALTE|nr:restriction modification system DNA specificity subunit [Alteromonas mediterranea 615]